MSQLPALVILYVTKVYEQNHETDIRTVQSAKRQSPSVTRWYTYTHTPFLSMSFRSFYCILLQVGSIRKTGHHMWSTHDLVHAREMFYLSISSPFSHCSFWQVIFNFSSLASQLFCNPGNLNLWSSGLSLPWIGDDGFVWLLHFIPSLVTAAHGASVAYDYSPWYRLSPTLSP